MKFLIKVSPMRKFTFSLLLFGLIASCTNTVGVDKTITSVVSGEMLFSGPNSLQAPVSMTSSALSNELNIEAAALSSIGVSGIEVSLAEEQVSLAESLLLQVVSNNNEMTALGTLSPLGNGTSFELNLAEEIDLLPFIEDEGATWVLDVNLSEDIMDEMKASVELELIVNFKH